MLNQMDGWDGKSHYSPLQAGKASYFVITTIYHISYVNRHTLLTAKSVCMLPVQKNFIFILNSLNTINQWNIVTADSFI